ncbi:hypothetical protein EUGRSUZ_K03051 [Eucalyptus grandis]|uniref:Uncharacterized protein n=2 Tax=Eucalyptus grandis TaxID=71139 RepID=A0ACC3IY70_EUCGR|nr:hypothetical protein EUGRSUZ_K03051 [Eucalyptus grandis]
MADAIYIMVVNEVTLTFEFSTLIFQGKTKDVYDKQPYSVQYNTGRIDHFWSHEGSFNMSACQPRHVLMLVRRSCNMIYLWKNMTNAVLNCTMIIVRNTTRNRRILYLASPDVDFPYALHKLIIMGFTNHMKQLHGEGLQLDVFFY